MQIQLKNYRGCAEASLELAPIALVAGLNHAGKSSIAQAVAAALTRNPAVLPGLTKAAARLVLRDGAKRGSCVVGDEAGAVTVNWPGGSLSEEGTGPRASEIACGLASVLDMKQKDAAPLLMRLIAASPSEADLRAFLEPAALPDALLSQVWSAIAADGWDAAWNRARERGARLKGSWEQVTGEAFGAKKAEDWIPAALPDPVPAIEDLEALADGVRLELEQAIAGAAVSGDRVSQLQAVIAAGQQALADAPGAVAAADDQDALVARLQAELEALPRPETLETLVACPHCAGHLVVVSRSEVRAPSGSVTADENAARQAAVAAKQQEVSAAMAQARSLRQRVEELGRQQNAGNRAEADLAALPQGGTSAEVIAQIRARQAELGQQIGAVRALESSRKLAGDIAASASLVEALAPTGVRHRVLTERMAAYNVQLAALCEVAGWPAVRIEDDLSISYGGRPVMLVSESEAYRARVVLQVSMAGIDGSELVIVDGADVLDRAGRNGLFRLLRHSGLRALVCMTVLDGAGAVPNLAAAGLGASYWIEHSVLAPIGEPAA